MAAAPAVTILFCMSLYRAELKYNFQGQVEAEMEHATAGTKFTKPGVGNLAHPCKLTRIQLRTVTWLFLFFLYSLSPPTCKLRKYRLA